MTTYCQRCLKYINPEPNNVHTCTPHPAAEELESLRARVAELEKKLERIANFPVLLKSLVQSDRQTIHGLKDIAAEALRGEVDHAE